MSTMCQSWVSFASALCSLTQWCALSRGASPLSQVRRWVPLTGGALSVWLVCADLQNTSVEGVYSVGDVCGKVQLTPMAIAAGRRLADRLFGGRPDAKVRHSTQPLTPRSTSGRLGVSRLTHTICRTCSRLSSSFAYQSSWIHCLKT